MKVNDSLHINRYATQFFHPTSINLTLPPLNFKKGFNLEMV